MHLLVLLENVPGAHEEQTAERKAPATIYETNSIRLKGIASGRK